MNAKQLKVLREKLGLTQDQMAEKLGLKIRMYMYIEKGEKGLSAASNMLANQLLNIK